MVHKLCLQNNSITSIESQAFTGLQNLTYLNLSINLIKYLANDAFLGLDSLLVLDLSGNLIYAIPGDIDGQLPMLNQLFSNDFRLCCIMKHVDTCTAPKALFSCSRLIQNTYIKGWISFLSLSILIFNSIVITKHGIEREFSVHTFLVVCLATSDMVFGVFLSIITISDTVYGEMYSLYDFQWRESMICHIAAVLSSVSFLMGAITITWLSVFRLSVIKSMRSQSKWLGKHITILVYTVIILVVSTGCVF